MTAIRMDILPVRITARCVVMVIIARIIPAMTALRGDILHVRLTAIYAKLIRFTALFMAMAAAPAVIAPAPEATNFLSEPAHCCRVQAKALMQKASLQEA